MTHLRRHKDTLLWRDEDVILTCDFNVLFLPIYNVYDLFKTLLRRH